MNEMFQIHEKEFGLACFVTVASAVVIFAAGYVLGRQQGLNKTLHQLRPSSLADVLYARISLSDRRGISSVVSNLQPSVLCQDQSSIDNTLLPLEEAEEEREDNSEVKIGSPVVTAAADALLYQAILAGYGTSEGAARYVQTLGKRGIPARVRERTGVHRGKPRVWYQVVTEPASRERTQEIVSILQKVDRLYDVILEGLDSYDAVSVH
jgi:hypothetical protein